MNEAPNDELNVQVTTEETPESGEALISLEDVMKGFVESLPPSRRAIAERVMRAAAKPEVRRERSDVEAKYNRPYRMIRRDLSLQAEYVGSKYFSKPDLPKTQRQKA